jgi:anti-anti-sigma regulatory factor
MVRGEQRQDGACLVELTGVLTVGAMPEARARLLAALQDGRPVTVDCSGASASDISFVQVLVAARALAMRLGTELRLATPLPPHLASLFVEGGFHEWASAPARSA